MSYKLYNGDCLKLMDKVPDNSIDMILCDLPYGTTSCEWDTILPFEQMWQQYNRVIKENGAIVLFGTEPFSSYLRLSNLKHWKYDWIWHKSKCGSSFTSQYRPQQKHEIISVFTSKGEKTNYYPILQEGEPYVRHRHEKEDKINNHKFGVVKDSVTVNDGFRYPETVLFFPQQWRRQDQVHPTQKPVELMEYLIKTYTLEGMTVLDSCMGSGTTGVACLNTNRNFIGIELESSYFDICKRRLYEVNGERAEEIIGDDSISFGGMLI